MSFLLIKYSERDFKKIICKFFEILSWFLSLDVMKRQAYESKYLKGFGLESK